MTLIRGKLVRGKEYIAQDVFDGDYDVLVGVLGHEEVVRCKDCIWHRENECYAWDDGTVAVVSETPDDGFCYRAEKKETK